MSNILTYLTNLFAFDQEHPLLFTQFNFWAFFLIVFALFSCLVGSSKWTPARRIIRNGYLFLVSLFFYYKTSGLFVLLLIFSTLLGYLLGIRFDKPISQPRRKFLMITGVTLNLLVLCYFKYAYFFTDIYNTLFTTQYQVVNHLAIWANHFTQTPTFDASIILLPVGISFFTFQNISYIVDVYQRKIPHANNIFDFGFYTTFFPQLVAGPIIRADQFIPQIYRPYFLSRRQFGIAIFWILNGLFKKIVLSDYLATSFVDRVFDNPLLYTPFENFSALMVYSLQVYADFSGYTDIAIGVAMLMGFYLPINFNSPYKATNAAGFWKRWHISLSNWLKDYLYIPLGGNRKATPATYLILAGILAIVALMAKNTWVTIAVATISAIIALTYLLFPKQRTTLSTNINNMDTMLLGGLWHGASFNFITWGGLNGLGILIYKWWKTKGPQTRILTITLVFALCYLLHRLIPSPLLNLLTIASGISFVGITLFNLYALLHRNQDYTTLVNHSTYLKIWNTLLTFIFISFTRLFFRSGSNLNPAEANETAWRTATQMVHQIGSHWNLQQIPDIILNYKSVFLMFLIGMTVHWLPQNFKRRYRLWFAHMPLWLMTLTVVLSILVIYQFITADLQPFIYFQF